MQDVSFRATVRARRLRFAEEPRTAVRFPGTGERTRVSRCDRTHLSDPVEPGRDYRDVTVAYRLETRLLADPRHDRRGDGGGTDT